MKKRTNLSIIFFLSFLFLITFFSCKFNKINVRVPEDPPSYPTSNILNIKVWEIRDLAYNKKFNELNKLLGKYESEFEKDYQKEDQANVAFDSFEIPDSKLKAPLLEWIKKYPDKFQPYLASAYYYNALAWQSRGYRYIKDTSPEQINGMERYIEIAKGYTNEAIKLYPKLALGYKLLINLYIHQADGKLIRKFLDKGLEICPQSFALRSTYMHTLLPRWGGSYRKMADFAHESEKYWNLNPQIKLLGGYIYNDMGRKEDEWKRYKKALEYFNKAVAFGENTEFLYERSTCYHYYLNDDKDALKDINKCITLKPYDIDYYLLRAYIYLSENRIYTAVKDFKQAERINPFNSFVEDWRKDVSQQYVSMGYKCIDTNLQKSLEFFNEGEEYSQNNSSLYFMRSYAYYNLGRYDESISDCKKAINIDPKKFNFYILIGNELGAKNKWDESIDYWNQYISLVPDNAKAYYEQSGLYYHIGNENLAIKGLKKACSLGLKKACQKLKQIQKYK